MEEKRFILYRRSQFSQFASFSQLKSKFTLPQSIFFRYLQIRNYVKKNIPQFINKPENHIIHDLLILKPDIWYLALFMLLQHLYALSTLKAVWSTELNEEVTDEI